MAKLSKTARASGATGKKTGGGPARSRQRCQTRRRAHKRDSLLAKPMGEGRDARKAEKRALRAKHIAALVKDAEERLDALQEEALAEDDARTLVDMGHEAALEATQ